MDETETSILALSPDDAGVFNWNVDTNLLFGDVHFAEIFGLEPESVLTGLPIEAYLAAVWEGDRRNVARTLHNVISTGGSCLQDFHILHPDGSMLHVVGIGRCFRNIANEATRYVGIVFSDVQLDDEKKQTLLAGHSGTAADTSPTFSSDDLDAPIVRAMNKLEKQEEEDEDDGGIVYH